MRTPILVTILVVASLPLLMRGAFALAILGYRQLGRPAWFLRNFSRLPVLLWTGLLYAAAALVVWSLLPLPDARRVLLGEFSPTPLGLPMPSWTPFAFGLPLALLVGVFLARPRRRSSAPSTPGTGSPYFRESLSAVTSAPPSLLLAIVLLEEFVYRGFAGLAFDTNDPLILAVAAVTSSLAYGAAHEYWGRRAVGRHAVHGLAYFGLYAAAGFALIVPIVAHATYNVAILRELRSARTRSTAAPLGGATP